MKWFLTFFLLYYTGVCQAQLTGEVSLNEYGLSFTIPDLWTGQEVEDGIVLVSSAHSGFIYLTLNSFESPEQMRAEIAKGIVADRGISLRPAGQVEEISPLIVGTMLEGEIENESTKAYCIALLNAEGYGVNILAATNASMYDASHEEAAIELAKSLKFETVDTIDVGLVAYWQKSLDHTSLYRMEADSGEMPSGGPTGTRIDLCSGGHFRYSSNPSLELPAGQTSANSSPPRGGDWEIQATTNGGAQLLLRFEGGELQRFDLSLNDEEHTFLDGERYLRISVEDLNGKEPFCP